MRPSGAGDKSLVGRSTYDGHERDRMSADDEEGGEVAEEEDICSFFKDRQTEREERREMERERVTAFSFAGDTESVRGEKFHTPTNA